MLFKFVETKEPTLFPLRLNTSNSFVFDMDNSSDGFILTKEGS